MDFKNIDGDVYKLKVIESSSPLTKKPSTPFRLGVIGLIEHDYCYQKKETVSELGESKVSEYPLIALVTPPSCDLSVDTIDVSGYVGETLTFPVFHGANSDFFDKYEVSSEHTDYVSVSGDNDEIKVRLVKEFSGSVTILVHYSNCLECELTANVVAQVKPTPPVDPEDPDDGDGGENPPPDGNAYTEQMAITMTTHVGYQGSKVKVWINGKLAIDGYNVNSATAEHWLNAPYEYVPREYPIDGYSTGNVWEKPPGASPFFPIDKGTTVIEMEVTNFARLPMTGNVDNNPNQLPMIFDIYFKKNGKYYGWWDDAVVPSDNTSLPDLGLWWDNSGQKFYVPDTQITDNTEKNIDVKIEVVDGGKRGKVTLTYNEL